MFQSWNILNECCCYRSCFILKWKVPIMQVLRRRQDQTDIFREWQRTPGGTNHGLRWWDPPKISRWYHGMSWLQFLAQGGGSVKLAAGFPMANHVFSAEKSTRETPTRWSLLQIHVSLPSGRGKTISVSRNRKVVDLKMAVQQSFGERFVRLVTADGVFCI